MNTAIKLAGTAALALALGVPAFAPAQAQQFGYSYAQPPPVYGSSYSVRSYAPGYRVEGPAMGAYAYAPAQESWGGYSGWNEQACTQSPASLSFQPCMNHGGAR
jgi:hypothetical protein